MDKIIDKVIEYGRYPSTWKGIITLLGLLGVVLSPEQSEYIAVVGIAVVGFISTFFSDADVVEKK